jgi:hypothetical protein
VSLAQGVLPYSSAEGYDEHSHINYFIFKPTALLG